MVGKPAWASTRSLTYVSAGWNAVRRADALGRDSAGRWRKPSLCFPGAAPVYTIARGRWVGQLGDIAGLCTPQEARIDRMAGLRRVAALALVSIPVAAEVVLGEALFIGHIVLLVQGLGFAWGLAVFIAIWAALGVVVLAVRDFVWPHMVPLLEPLLARFTSRSRDVLRRTGTKVLLTAVGVSGVSAAVALAIALAGDEIKDWAIDHRTDVATFLAAVVVVFLILLVIARLGRALQSWVRRVADTAGPATHLLATLVTMMMLGPARAWPVFRLLGYSSRSTYAPTLVAAPVFGAVWVPLYGLGLWGVIEGLF